MKRVRLGSVPGAGLVARVFRSVAELRRARVFHPRGILLDGELETLPGGPLGIAGQRLAVTARLSKGVGLPARVWDILGVALRVHDGDRLWDLTFASAGSGRLGRMLPRPAASWSDATYSSLAPYRTPTGLTWLLAEIDGARCGDSASTQALPRLLERGPIELIVSAVCANATSRPAARVRLRQARGDAEHPSYDPMRHPPPGLRLYPQWLSTVRELAYQGSRLGREKRSAERR